MDALNDFMLYLEKLRILLAPLVMQGTAALDPLVRAYPWPFLFGAFVLGIVAITAFRIVTSLICRLVLLPFVLIAGYLLYSSASRVIQLIVPLLQTKFAGVF